MNATRRASVHRVLVNYYSMSLRKLLKYLNASIDPAMIEKIFKTYLDKKDY